MDLFALSQVSGHPFPLNRVVFVTIVMVVAAIIDGRQLRVPNWLTYPLVFAGWGYHLAIYGWAGLGWSLVGTVVGFATLILPYAVGGMGAGDVKLWAGFGAWMLPKVTLYAYAWSAIIGGVLAVGMVLWEGQVRRHLDLFHKILIELAVVRNPERLAEIAAARKPTMTLLPYGIPLALGAIGYFVYSGLLPVF